MNHDHEGIIYDLLLCAMRGTRLPPVDYTALALEGYPMMLALDTALSTARAYGSDAVGPLEWTLETVRRYVDAEDR